MKYDSVLDIIKKDILVLDVETSAHYPNGKEVPIGDFDAYVAHAKVKFFGAFSYKDNTYYQYRYDQDFKKIADLLNSHNILVAFNGEDFDIPIIKNNGLIEPDKYQIIVDCMVILGRNTFKTRGGYAYKNRGELMDYKFKNNKLRTMAEAMELETQKGEINYEIFNKNNWTEKEIEDITKYLKADVMATKQMFDKLWVYWLPFTELLDEKSVRDLSWIRNSIASLTYKSACYSIGVEPTYAEKGTSGKEEMGGFVLEPQVEEKTDVFYCDYSSLYPHVMCMFNLFAESQAEENNPLVWRGNEMFETVGYYNISKKHPLTDHVLNLLKMRMSLKKDDPLYYTIKLLVNSLYGVIRSSLFEKVHTPNAGWDTCYLSQQLNKYTHKRLNEMGFVVIYADTDSSFIYHTEKEKNIESYVQECLGKIVSEILVNVPFPAETFNIKIETKMDYILFPFSEQEIVEEETRQLLSKGIVDGYIEDTIDKNKVIIDTNLNKIVKVGRSWVKELRGRKKNYIYIHEKDGKKEIKIVGLPIKKDNATELSLKIFNEVLSPLIIKNNRAIFAKDFIEKTVAEYLEKPGIIETLAREYKVQPYDSYKKPESQIHAQISKEYFNGADGVIKLIANDKIGKVGKGKKYATIDEVKEAKLKVNDLDFEKLWSELEPFTQHIKESIIKETSKDKISKNKKETNYDKVVF
jgi:DNA polymerase elongation subunit (family B)